MRARSLSCAAVLVRVVRVFCAKTSRYHYPHRNPNTDLGIDVCVLLCIFGDTRLRCRKEIFVGERQLPLLLLCVMVLLHERIGKGKRAIRKEKAGKVFSRVVAV